MLHPYRRYTDKENGNPSVPSAVLASSTWMQNAFLIGYVDANHFNLADAIHIRYCTAAQRAEREKERDCHRVVWGS